MGFKASMIIIKQQAGAINNEELLKELGFGDIKFSGETTFEECMYPNDNSINIGHYNGCIVISDDYQLTTSLELYKTPQLLIDYEHVLTHLYPEQKF